MRSIKMGGILPYFNHFIQARFVNFKMQMFIVFVELVLVALTLTLSSVEVIAQEHNNQDYNNRFGDFGDFDENFPSVSKNSTDNSVKPPPTPPENKNNPTNGIIPIPVSPIIKTFQDPRANKPELIIPKLPKSSIKPVELKIEENRTHLLTGSEENDQPLSSILNKEFKLRDKRNSVETRKIYDYRNVTTPKILQKTEFNALNRHIPTVFYQSDYSRLLFSAVMQNNIGAIKAILARMADINTKLQPEGITPLIMAIQYNLDQSTYYLVLRGADINLPDNNKKAPLHYAALARNIDVFNYLLSNGANMYVKDAMGRTAIDYLPSNLRNQVIIDKFNTQIEKDRALLNFSSSGLTSSTKYLLDHGANVNIVDPDGNTPIMLAVVKSDIPTVALLINYGADLNRLNNSGENIIMLARKSNNPQLVHIIESSVIKTELETGTPSNIHFSNKRISLPAVHQALPLSQQNDDIIMEPEAVEEITQQQLSTSSSAPKLIIPDHLQ